MHSEPCWLFPLEPTNLNKRSIKPIIRHLMRLITIFDTIQASNQPSNQRILYIILWPIPRIYTIYTHTHTQFTFLWCCLWSRPFLLTPIRLCAICTDRSQRSMLTKFAWLIVCHHSCHVKVLFCSTHSASFGSDEKLEGKRQSENSHFET